MEDWQAEHSIYLNILLNYFGIVFFDVIDIYVKIYFISLNL